MVGVTSYGRASGFCIDPIEKAAQSFLPGTSVLSFGTASRLPVLPELGHLESAEIDKLGAWATPEMVATQPCGKAAEASRSPTTSRHLRNMRSTAPGGPRAREDGRCDGRLYPPENKEFFAQMDAANVDPFTERFYEKCALRTSPVLDTLRYLPPRRRCGSNHDSAIAGQNDSEQVCPAFRIDRDKPRARRRCTSARFIRTSNCSMRRARLRLLSRAESSQARVRHVCTGNVHDPNGQSTYCSKCDAVLIARDGYELGAGIWMSGVAACRTPLAGRFEARPGTWAADASHRVARAP